MVIRYHVLMEHALRHALYDLVGAGVELRSNEEPSKALA